MAIGIFYCFCVKEKWRPLFHWLSCTFFNKFHNKGISQLVLSDNVIAWLIELLTGLSIALGFLYTMKASVFGLALFGSMLHLHTLWGFSINR